jgi:hypothetical protein
MKRMQLVSLFRIELNPDPEGAEGNAVAFTVIDVETATYNPKK